MKHHRSSWHRDLRREWELGWFLSVADLGFLTESSWLWGGLRRVVLGNTHARHPALFSLWTCVKMSDCTPSNGTQLPHGAVRSMRRLIIGNCLFRRRGQVLRKSSIPWRFFSILQATDSLPLFSAELMKPNQQKNMVRDQPWSVAVIWQEGKEVKNRPWRKEVFTDATEVADSVSENPPYSVLRSQCCVQSLSCVWLLTTPWTAAHQASLASAVSWSLFKLCPLSQRCHLTISSSVAPFFLLPSIFASIKVFSKELALWIKWPEQWTFSFSMSPSNEYWGLISFRMDWLDLHAVQETLKSLLQHHSSKSIHFLALTVRSHKWLL